MMGRPVRIKYGKGFIDIPPTSFHLKAIQPAFLEKEELSLEEIEKKISQPIASREIEELHGDADRVLIVVSDATRVTCVHRFLPAILKKLLRSGVREENIRFIFATGVHRKVTVNEKSSILGETIIGRYQHLDHDPYAESSLSLVGRTSRGTTVRVNSEVLKASKIILTGAIDLHYHAGFTGGRKSLMPGLAGHDTAASNHLLSLVSEGEKHPCSDVGILESNPVHEDMLEGALMVPSPFIVNSIIDERGGIEEIFAGDMVRAHWKGAEYLNESRRIKIERKARMVVAGCGGYPKDINVIQANKCIQNCSRLVEDGGVLILVAQCSEGYGSQDFAGWLSRGKAGILYDMKRQFKSYAQTALSIIHAIESINVIFVTDFRSEVLQSLGIRQTGSLGEAFQLAEVVIGKEAEGLVIENGPRWFFHI
ncbi:MAG: nickel-dependent lactate racemase [Acidobacteriota bacterium]